MPNLKHLFLSSTLLVSTISFAAEDVPYYKGTETLPYTVIETLSDDIEIRSYAESVKVSVREDGETSAFRVLFKYITGANTVGTNVAMTSPVEMSTAVNAEISETDSSSTKIAMTTPVEMRQDTDKAKMSFFLPSIYSYETAPKPTDSRVFLEPVPAAVKAVIKFSGFRTRGKIANKTKLLTQAINQAGYTIVSQALEYGYEDPFTLPWNRRNEVAFLVEKD
jgi:hypothetical protein